MLRRIRHIALLLLIVLTAQGQNIGSYECWIDADYSSRVTSTIVGSSIEQSIDIGRLSQGVHYLNFRASDPNEGICPLYRYMFFVPGKELTESDMTQYEYWIDADYAHRVSTAATGTEALQTIDVSSLSQGVHYLNFRAISASEGICPLTRYMFFVPESENALEQVDRIEYWLDDAEDSLQTMSVDQSGELAIVMDISHLQPDSTHYFNIRGVMKNGQLGLSERYDFSFSVPTAEPYAVLTGDTISGMTLTFYYDDQKAIRGGTDVKPFKLGWYDDVWTVNSGWHDQCNALTSVVFDESFANCTTLTSTDYWFYSCGNLATIQGIENLKTDNVTSMDCMFWGCSGLTNLDVSGFKTDSVTDTYAMFYNCSRLTSLDLSGFNMSKVEYMNQMFAGCSALKTIYAGDWNVPAIIDGSYMFYGCSSLVGGKGTTYNENRVDYTYAHIDGGPSNPGYFTSLWSDRKLVQWRQVGGKEYRLYKASHKNEARTNADGWNMYRTRLTLDIISGTDTTTTVVDDGSIYCEQNLFNNGMTQCMMIDVENNKMYVFANSKTDARDYSMDGYVYISPIEQPSFTKEIVFSDANWGWFSYFRGVENGQPLLSHFSYMGYYDELSKRNADGTWSTNTEDSPIASPSNRESNWLVTRKFTVVGDTSSDEVTLDGVTYTVRNGGNAWVTWLDNCTYVESLTVPETLTADGRTLTVNGLAPLSCYTLTRLQYLELPSTMDMLGESVLIRCGNLRSLTVNRNEPPTLVLDNGVLRQFTDIDSVNCVLRVPYGSKALYESAEGWRKFQNIADLDAPVAEPEPYAVLSEDSLTVTFYYDGQKAARGGIDINNSVVIGSNANPQYGTATAAVIDPSFAGYRPTSTAYWFQNCYVLASITGMENLKTDNVTDMQSMFFRCDSLKSLDVSHFNTEKVRNMSAMFTSCGSLTSLDVSNFKTDNVTNMRWMFNGCSSLTYLHLLGWNTFSVTDMNNMFYGCHSLTTLILSTFLTNNVTDMSSMFEYCSGLTSIFINTFNTDKVKDMSNMFNGCMGLTELDLRDFNTANVTNMTRMFSSCFNLRTIFVGDDWSTAAVKESQEMFSNSYNLIGGKGTRYDWVHNDYVYARIDEGPGSENPGYFTRSGDEPYVPIDATFDSNGVLSVAYSTTMSQALEFLGGREEVAKRITVINWYSSAPLTNDDLQGLDNPNLLIYVYNGTQAPDRNNVIIDGRAKNVVLADAKEGNNNFYCPQAFTAEKVSYTRDFQQQTQVGVSRGWESIALPFTVQTISHESQGTIAPFGNNASNKHFWLRRLGDNGLMQAAKIEANVPYIISMPNNSEAYYAEYNLSGKVTFTAQDVTVPVTAPVTLARADSTIKMVPAFQSIGRSSDVWAINVGETRGQYFEGSVFERDYREVRPFEAYTIHRSDTPAPRFVPIMDIGGTTGIEDVRSQMSDGRGENCYDLQGRKVANGKLPRGVYIRNGKKTVVR